MYSRHHDLDEWPCMQTTRLAIVAHKHDLLFLWFQWSYRATILALFFFQFFGVSEIKYTWTNTITSTRDLVSQDNVTPNRIFNLFGDNEARSSNYFCSIAGSWGFSTWIHMIGYCNLDFVRQGHVPLNMTFHYYSSIEAIVMILVSFFTFLGSLNLNTQ